MSSSLVDVDAKAAAVEQCSAIEGKELEANDPDVPKMSAGEPQQQQSVAKGVADQGQGRVNGVDESDGVGSSTEQLEEAAVAVQHNGERETHDEKVKTEEEVMSCPKPQEPQEPQPASQTKVPQEQAVEDKNEVQQDSEESGQKDVGEEELKEKEDVETTEQVEDTSRVQPNDQEEPQSKSLTEAQLEVLDELARASQFTAPPPRITIRQASANAEEVKKEIQATARPVLRKASMTTSIDTEAVRAAYEDVRSDTSDTDWAVFKFLDQNIVCSATGIGFDEFRSHFHDDERAFGFIRIQMGDEMSKRQKFVFITWLGPKVSVIRRAKMSIDKTMVKDIVKNFAVELQMEALSEIDAANLREQLSRVGGANYGTGFRDL